MKHMNQTSLATFILCSFGLFTQVFGANTPAEIEQPHKTLCVSGVAAVIIPDSCGRGASIALTPINAQGDVTYRWSHDPTLTDSLAPNLTGGEIIQVVITDDACQIDTSFIVPFVPVLIVDGTVTPDTCGERNGTAAVSLGSIGNGQGPYTFQWGPNAGSQTTSVAIGLDLGIYQVLVTDANGCQGVWVATVPTTRDSFDVNLDFSGPACFGEASGQATVDVIGGTGQYEVYWLQNGNDTLGRNDQLGNIAAGQYEVTVIDQGGRCQFNQNFSLSEPEPLSTEIFSSPTTLCQSDNGFARVVPSGGTAPYSYLWSNGGSNDTISNVAADTYSVVVTDDNGCEASSIAFVTSEPGPEFEVQILQSDNCGLGEGIARLRITKGVAPFQVLWQTFATQDNDTSLFAYNLIGQNTYRVLVYDSDSCFDFQDFFVPGRNPLTITSTATEPNYCDLGNGTASVSVSGGTLPYTYQWNSNPVQQTARATDLIEGPYTVTVRDSFNCEVGTILTVGDEVGFTIDVTQTDETCFGREDGTATVSVQNGRPPFNYRWNSQPLPQFEATATNLPGGPVEVVVSDQGGCERTSFANIASQDFLEAAFSADPDTLIPIALSEAVFRFSNQTVGGNSYLWDFGDGNQSADFAPQHTYTEVGNYFTKLVATNNSSGCKDSVILGPYLVIPDGLLFVPNAFTPNGDGINDFLRIQGEALENFTFSIYDRWGTVMFSTNSISEVWDGKMPGGRAAPEGVYMYSLQATAPGEQPLQELGTITIYR